MKHEKICISKKNKMLFEKNVNFMTKLMDFTEFRQTPPTPMVVQQAGAALI
jgi:hypothetical protein